jgi:hypothetical protein
MKALCKAIPGSAERKRHKRRCQGPATVHEQVTNGVGHGVRADKKPPATRALSEDYPHLGNAPDFAGCHHVSDGWHPSKEKVMSSSNLTR